MAVQQNAANLIAHFLAQLPDNTAGTITPARHRAALQDVADTFFNAGVMRGLVLADDVITSAMLAAGAADRNALPDDVINTAKLNDGAVTTNKLGDNQVTLQKLAANARVAAWATRTGAAGRMPRAQAYGDTVTGVAQLNASNVVVITQADGTTIELDLSSLAGGGGTTPTAPATRYYGVSPDQAFAASEYHAASTTGGITIDAGDRPAVNSYLAFAIPNDAADPTYYSPNHPSGDNQFSILMRIPGTITLGGVAHKAWRTQLVQFPPIFGRTLYFS